jgi:hypothetical protein
MTHRCRSAVLVLLHLPSITTAYTNSAAVLELLALASNGPTFVSSKTSVQEL